MKLSVATVLCLLLGACGAAGPSAVPVETAGEGSRAAAGPMPPANLEQWARSCALCHVRGEGGAPRLGDQDAWQARWRKGEDTLLTHTIEGFNNMPPLGYCMDCSREDFRRLIRFMAVGS